jgi:hypothetical protein
VATVSSTINVLGVDESEGSVVVGEAGSCSFIECKSAMTSPSAGDAAEHRDRGDLGAVLDCGDHGLACADPCGEHDLGEPGRGACVVDQFGETQSGFLLVVRGVELGALGRGIWASASASISRNGVVFIGSWLIALDVQIDAELGVIGAFRRPGRVWVDVHRATGRWAG